MDAEVARATKVRPIAGRDLRVRFAGDREDHELDMTGLIARSTHFALLIDDAESFATIVIVEDGLGVAWPIQTKWGRLDVSAATLRRIAEEQEPMSGAFMQIEVDGRFLPIRPGLASAIEAAWVRLAGAGT